MGLISPGGENLLDFLELWQVLSTYDGNVWDMIWWPQERPVPMRVVRVLLGIPLPSMPGPEASSPVLTWILEYSGVSPGKSVLVSFGGIHVRFPLEL